MTEREAIKYCKGMIQRLERPAFMVQYEGAINDIMALEIAISALKKQEQDRWISVTDRLLEYGTEVLTQLSDNDVVVNWVIDEEDEEWFEYGVVAWRPLPELYEGL